MYSDEYHDFGAQYIKAAKLLAAREDPLFLAMVDVTTN
jgi:hypothetical protein